MRRREFMGAVAASAALLAAERRGVASPLEDAALPKRPLGKSGIDLSVIGFSGIVARGNTHEGVERAVEDSLARGINFFDTAASYGNSEEMMGPVLRPHRKDIVLATKTRLRTREGAKAEFERSCELLYTDYFDMYLVHGIQHVDRDVEAAFAADGAMEYLLEQKAAGAIRLLGFSAHSNEAALEAMARHDFDFFYFPVSYASWYKGDFGPAVLAKAREKGIPCISLKAMARQRWPEEVPRAERCAGCWYQPIDDDAEGSLALRWALSQGVVSVLPPGNEALYRKTLALSQDLRPVSEPERQHLETLCGTMDPLFPRG